LLANQLIDPWAFKKLAQVLDNAIEGVKKSLAITRITLEGREKQDKSPWFATVIGVDEGELKKKLIRVTRKQGPLLKYKTKHFRPSDAGELTRLIDRGVTLVPAIFPRRDSDKPKKETPPAIAVEDWICVPVDAGTRMMNNGCAVLWSWENGIRVARVKRSLFAIYWPMGLEDIWTLHT
jgi:hypothetical protein